MRESPAAATDGDAAGCRVCRQPLYPRPLLGYSNMPCAAQAFPEPGNEAADRGSDLAVRQCAGCGLIQLAGAPVPYYREVIRAAAFSEEMRAFRVAQFGQWIAEFALGGKRVLEVGCGRGEYLALLAGQGVSAYGIEHSSAAVIECRRRGLDVAQGFFEDADGRVDGGPFDAFACFNFMEHWPDPVATLRGVSANLVDGGLGLIEVPNFDMIERHGLYSEFISDHLSYFTRETFSLALGLAGFEVVRCTAVWHDYILSAVVRKRSPMTIDRLIRRREDDTRALRAFVGRFPARSVAVWGAGHQALAVLALSGIAHDIRYVVDSAPFKQGKMTPATHLPIVSPERLQNDPVRALVIMAASYSDEVLATVRRLLGDVFPVAILREQGIEVIDGG